MLGLVGESGSGKTTTALALLGYARPGHADRRGHRRRSRASRLPLGDERAVRRAARPHDLVRRAGPVVGARPDGADRPGRAGDARRPRRRAAGSAFADLLAAVGLPVRRGLPAALSARALGRSASSASRSRPRSRASRRVVVLDEPTTGLDVITQARVLAEIRRIRAELGIALVYVSHDLAVVAEIADEIAVLYAGRVVEHGPRPPSWPHGPRHPYTRGLRELDPRSRAAAAARRRCAASPPASARGPQGCAFAPRCDQAVPACSRRAAAAARRSARAARVRCLEHERTPPLALGDPLVGRAAAGEPVPRARGRGARGDLRGGRDRRRPPCATSALRARTPGPASRSSASRARARRPRRAASPGLHRPAAGSILLDGKPLAAHARDRSRDDRRRIQIIFQNPFESLNPRHRVGEAIIRPARILRGLDRAEGERELAELLEQVRLPARVGVALPRRALRRRAPARRHRPRARGATRRCSSATRSRAPSTSRCRRRCSTCSTACAGRLGLAILFITHDLGVVAAIADDVVVLEQRRGARARPGRPRAVGSGRRLHPGAGRRGAATPGGGLMTITLRDGDAGADDRAGARGRGPLARARWRRASVPGAVDVRAAAAAARSTRSRGTLAWHGGWQLLWPNAGAELHRRRRASTASMAPARSRRSA